ncbi:hypothetical protein B0H11DRAFT_316930 [Mycena galericulata]|nr:hypothetical protein B0H11DRAFT_316930 [Mycena galericulata]
MDPRSSSGSSYVGKAGGYEKSFDQSTVVSPSGGRALLSQLMGWPILVIGGHLILQILAWSFFTVLEVRGFVALPYLAADWASDHVHTVTLISTLISTGLAGCSSFLFSWGVQKSISIYLHREGMSLEQFDSSVKISARTLVLDHRKWKWSVASIVLVILTAVQTSGWSTLLTPQLIVIQTPLTGTELDLSSPLLQQMQSSGALDDCVFDSSNIAAFTVGQTESGYATLKDDLGFPASLTLMDQTFDVNTAGILPLTLVDVNVSTWFSGTTILPATLRPAFELPWGLSSNYSMTQQGFSTLVNCEFQNVSTETTPNISVTTDTVKDWSSGEQNGNITFTQLQFDCPVSADSGFSSTSAYTTGDQINYLMMVGCQTQENYTLVFQSSGTYDFMRTTVCTLSPQITKVDVLYSDSDPLVATLITDTSQIGAVTDAAGGPAGLSAVTTISNMLFVAQAFSSNIMGDELNSLLEVWSDGDNYQDSEVLYFTEEYIRGVAEYSGSVLRACLSADNEVFAGGVPSNMTTTTEGMFFTQTVGWLRFPATTFFVLIPGAIVAFGTISLVLAVLGHPADVGAEAFDPTDAIHILAASAAGGLHDIFKGTADQDIEAANGVHVVLECIPDRGPALIRRTT